MQRVSRNTTLIEESTKESYMETIKFGLMLTVIPFITIFLFITIWWALVDISVKKIKGSERALWTLLVILLPAVG